MTHEQKIVAKGAASGVIGMVLLTYGLYQVLPTVADVTTFADRLAYTLRMNVVAVIPFFIMLVTVGNSRFLSEAINPLVHKESESMTVDGRVADNTLQQNFVFLIASLALTTTLAESQMSLITALTTVFVMARVAFWIGYRKHPLYRAPGMAATSYMNLGMLVWVLFRAFF